MPRCYWRSTSINWGFQVLRSIPSSQRQFELEAFTNTVVGPPKVPQRGHRDWLGEGDDDRLRAGMARLAMTDGGRLSKHRTTIGQVFWTRFAALAATVAAASAAIDSAWTIAHPK